MIGWQAVPRKAWETPIGLALNKSAGMSLPSDTAPDAQTVPYQPGGVPAGSFPETSEPVVSPVEIQDSPP
eukprot:407530-Pyramimonas_sp.AAC.1